MRFARRFRAKSSRDAKGAWDLFALEFRYGLNTAVEPIRNNWTVFSLIDMSKSCFAICLLRIAKPACVACLQSMFCYLLARPGLVSLLLVLQKLSKCTLAAFF